MNKRFVFAVVGERHVRQASAAISFLKRVTHRDILLIAARSEFKPPHDQTVIVDVPSDLDEHAASIFLKVGLHSRLGGSNDVFCYLDSDVIAVNSDVNEVFSQQRGVVAFAADHTCIDRFSSHAIRCGCAAPPCPHLRDRIKHDFGISIPDPNWRMWNGGVFTFGPESGEFMQRWQQLTLSAIKNPFWHTRDQGTLAAAAWDTGLQANPMLDSRFNTLVDRFKGVPMAERAGLPLERYTICRDYSLTDYAGRRPAFLHFINGGCGRDGWLNWDELPKHNGRPDVK